MRRILILANSSIGLYSFRYELLLELVKEYEVYVSIPDHIYDREFTSLGIKLIETPINRRGVNPIQDLMLLFGYMKLIGQIKPDVVLTYTIKPNVYGGLACRLRKVPYLVNVTGLGAALEAPGLLQLITKILYRIGTDRAEAVFAQNVTNLEFLKKKKITKAPKILLPGSGVNVSKFNVLEFPSIPSFIFIARIMKEKGIEEYLECAKTIHSTNVDVQFHVLGDCEEDYRDELSRLHEKGVIIYHGSVKDVRPYLAQARCIIHPSLYEGMSNVCLEAAASGRAIITIDRPGCRETVVDGKTGFVISKQDSNELIEAVTRFMQMDDEAQRKMGLEGRVFVEQNFDRQIVVKKYKESIAKLIDQE